jgi:glycerol dehydrogenase
MLSKIQFPGKYLQGSQAVEQLPDIVAAYGSRGLVVASKSAARILEAKFGHTEASRLVIFPFGGECCETELTKVAGAIEAGKADVVIGMGGGKAIDTAKIAADRAGLPVIIVPTIASTDAPCSGCAILYSDAGVFESVYYQKANPDVVLVDTGIIANAPARFLVSGMGDALSTWFEARSCAATHAPNCCGGVGSMTGLSLARLCFDTLLRYGASAKAAAENHLVTPAFERIVEANTLLSGVGFESGGLASAHAIHNGLTALGETHAFYHGEKVAIGTLAGLALTDASPEETATVYAFCEEVGLPTTLADIGLKDADRAKLRLAAEKACAPEEAIHHEAGTISPEMVLNALLAADAIGRGRKQRVR